MPAKNRYAIDKQNRLVVSRGRKKLIADGRFSIDRDNCLVYTVKEDGSLLKDFGLGQKVRLYGKWNLNPDYDLELTLDASNRQYEGDKLALKGDIISPEGDALAFTVSAQDKSGQLHAQILKLTGSWQADESNRLSFLVKKEDAPETITLTGSWKVNENQQISFTYQKVDLKRKTKISKSFTFSGFWQIGEGGKLTYILAYSRHSRIEFRAQIESPTLYPKDGVIRYRLGVGVRGPEISGEKIISLYGVWKIGKDLGLSFEIDYGQRRVRSLEFSATAYLSADDEFIFLLENKKREPLGVSLIFTHKFLKKLNAEASLRIKKSQEESRFEAGIRIPF